MFICFNLRCSLSKHHKLRAGHWVTDSGSCLKKWLRFLQKRLQRINKALKSKFKEACLFHSMSQYDTVIGLEPLDHMAY